MKILLFGSAGYLGEQFLQLYPDAVCPKIDIADAKAVVDVLDKEKPDIVINCAGKTGRPNVDWCEDHKEETIHANVTGPLVLLKELSKRGIYWVHMSSGCIYEGDNGGDGFTEDDAPNFFGSFYSRSKAWSDQILSEFPVLILRIRMPFDDTLHPRSLITKIRKYNRVLDVPNTLTYLPDFREAARILIEKRKTGIYNIVNPGAVSPYQVMKSYQEIVDPEHSFEKLTLSELSDVTKAGRSNCVLSVKKLESEGITMKSGKDAVQTALRVIAKSGQK
jgi:3,5-epimerase/4-reductase